MAKWGEGDPRWIVEECVDATNVNNWHWSVFFFFFFIRSCTEVDSDSDSDSGLGPTGSLNPQMIFNKPCFNLFILSILFKKNENYVWGYFRTVCVCVCYMTLQMVQHMYRYF